MATNSPSTTFSIAGKGLKLTTADDLAPYIAALGNPSSGITHVDLSGNTLGIDACGALAPLLTSHSSTLISADLHDIFTGRLLSEIPQALTHLLSALLTCPKLTWIDLSDNAFGLNTKDPLVSFLSQHTPLSTLILNNNGMGPIAGTSIADALTTLASVKSKSPSAPHLTHLVCGRNRLESGSMAAWARTFSAHAHGIQSVKMTQNGIRPEGISMLLTAGLSKCHSLHTLDLQDNTFTLSGSLALSVSLPGWPTLLELGVGDSLLGARGAVKVFEALGKGGNKSLEVLRSQYNDITSPGVTALHSSAKSGNLPKLRRVELNGNKFDEDNSDIEGLREMLSERKEERGKEDDPEEYWGLDGLDELEEEDSDEEDNEEVMENEEEKEDVKGTILQDADEEKNSKIPQKEDQDVDELAEGLKKTTI